MKLFIEADSAAKPQVSGIGHSCLEIIKAFDKLAQDKPDLRVTVIVPFGKKSYIEMHNLKNIRIRSTWPGQKVINYLLTRTSLPIPIDLWFGRGVYLFPNYKNWFVPFSYSLTFVHDMAFKSHPNSVNQKNRRYLETNINRWIKRTDKVLCISKAASEELKTYLPYAKSKVHVVHLGVNPAVYAPASRAAIKDVMQRYDIKGDYFIFVGNIEPRKNLITLLDAYKQYSDTNKNARSLVLIGSDGWNNEDILDTIVSLQKEGYDVIHPKQYVPDEDLPPLYSGARALVHVALNEGFGISPLQAQACGTPTIVSDLPVFREILDPKNTTFVSTMNVNQLTKALNSNKTGVPSPVLFTWERTVLGIMSLIHYK